MGRRRHTSDSHGLDSGEGDVLSTGNDKSVGNQPSVKNEETQKFMPFCFACFFIKRYEAGLNSGTDIWSVARWKVTSTAIPMDTSLGSHSTMLVNMRTPSSSSTRAST